ncbi:DUF305 domain-containing protein [Aeromicrobium terrae]|uniref:DUF305 domain-containing protein n=1 Tax=Aeromicrobium terrae TaxID=2498846 RepID=A0A5C8NDP8_9ACTN|nr:DUF305 domain-containing protein [Aeromicrobium terrae]TXL56553.1 DUF305 domain-containing protein [Aeromicrobium terrae]
MRLLAPLLAAVLLLAGCGGDTDHNEADIDFAQQMVPHHEQALAMADLVDDAGASAEVRDLAAQVAKNQRPEIRTLKAWLDDWDPPDPPGHGMAHMREDSMMSDFRMNQLAAATGTEFDRLWLKSMIQHHEGAVTMAEREMRDGENSEAIDLAHDITRTQVREIDLMKELLR